MNKKVLKTLEFDKIINLLLKFSQTEIGKSLILSSEIKDDIDEIKLLLEETNEALSLLITRSMPIIANIKDMSDDFEMLKLGRYFIPGKLLEVARILNTSRYLSDFFKKEDLEKFPNLYSITSTLAVNYSLESDIKNSIISDSEISDNASTELHRIRKQIASKNDLIKDKLNSIISSSDKLMDRIYTLREGRYVVPVKAEFKNSFKGIIHDQSSSGQTVYIEPLSVIELNNNLKKLEIEEEKEIERILINLSNKVLENIESIIDNINLIAKIDFIIAKGKLANELNCTMPNINKNGKMILNSARHPLIDSGVVVPIDIELGTDFNTLVITGPNTGGKTVTLKTVGLLTLMTQYGLLIPVKENSEVAVFDEIFADIGDEQSIEQSLSTFSSHMKNIVSIINSVKPNSLLLFDELGSGTDPDEGSGLSIAILNYFLEKGIRTIATTHYSQLKMYAMTTDNVKNAAVEFDVEKLQPTYKLIIGISGKSNAFEISKKLGLDSSFIEEAKRHISNRNISFDNLIGDVDNTRKKYEKLLIENEKNLQHSKKLKEEYEKKLDLFQEQKNKKIKKLEEYIQNKINETDKFYRESIREINKAKSDLKLDRIKSISDNINRNLENIENNKNKKHKKIGFNIDDLILGEEVKILSLNENGYIQTLPDKNGNLQIKVGILKITSHISDIIRIENVLDKNKENIVKTNTSFIKSNDYYSNRIDVRGMNSEEAILEIDKFLDNSFIVNLGEVTIIHGKGTGVLRNSVREFLKKHKHVKSFEFGKLNEGGDGATIVKLK